MAELSAFNFVAVYGHSWFLGGSTAWPGVTPADVEIGDGGIAAKYPAMADTLRVISAGTPRS